MMAFMIIVGVKKGYLRVFFMSILLKLLKYIIKIRGVMRVFFIFVSMLF